MVRCRFMILALFAPACLAATEPAAGIGYYNLPGNVAQFVGYGNGAGYHSCLVLGPTSCRSCLAGPNEVRLPYPPRPPVYGCCGQHWFDTPSVLPPAEARPPYPEPAPAAMRPQVLR